MRNGNTIIDLLESAEIDQNKSRFDFIYTGTTWAFAVIDGCGQLSQLNPDYRDFDCVIASASDERTPLEVSPVDDPHTTFRAPYALDVTDGYVRASLRTAPEGSPLIVDIHMNGTTMFTTPIYIDASDKTSLTAAIQSVLAITLIPDDAEFEVFVTQIGSTVAGAALNVSITGAKAEP